MGYHDREDDDNYSNTLRTPRGAHAYRHMDSSALASIAEFTAPAMPHQRIRRITLAIPLTEGTRVRCVKKAGIGPIVETLDGTFVSHVSPQDALDLDTQLNHGPLPGQASQNHVDLELEA